MSKKQSIMMRLAQHFNRFQSAAVYQIMQRSLTLLFPFVLIGSISQLIQLALFNRNSFVVNVFHLSNWLSKRNIFQMMFDSITSLTLGIVAALAAMCAARYTAKHYKRDEQLASITGLIAYLILALRLTPNEAYLSTARCWEWGAYFFGLLVGYLTGLAFKKIRTTSSARFTVEWVSSRTFIGFYVGDFIGARRHFRAECPAKLVGDFNLARSSHLTITITKSKSNGSAFHVGDWFSGH